MKTASEHKRVVFRVDGGRVRGISLGHLFRCLTLAKKLSTLNSNLDIRFLMRDFPAGITIAKEHGWAVDALAVDVGCQTAIQTILGMKPDLVVFDILEVESYLRFPDWDDVKIVVLDDLGNKEVRADLLVNGSIIPEQLQYSQNQSQKSLLGERYCILSPEFEIDRKVEVREQVSRVSVFMGGADPAGLTLKVCESLSRSYQGKHLSCELEWVLGSAFMWEDALMERLAGWPWAVRVTKRPQSLAEVFAETDAVICAGGRTAYEVISMGKPALLIPSIDHEVALAKILNSKGACLAFCDGYKLGVEHFETDFIVQFEELLAFESRERLFNTAKSILDAKGADRISGEILNLI